MCSSFYFLPAALYLKNKAAIACPAPAHAVEHLLPRDSMDTTTNNLDQAAGQQFFF